MTNPVQPSDRGILKAEAGRQKFTLTRYEPGPEMDDIVEHYWLVRWDLRGQKPYDQTILSFPNVQLTFEQDHNGTFAGVYGIPSRPYTRHLLDAGKTFGVKFRPGGFYPFWKQPVSLLSGKVLDIVDVFGEPGKALLEHLPAQDDGRKMAEMAERFLRERVPERDGNVELLNRIVLATMTDREILRVEDMVSRFGINKRSLQRLFNRYVGVGPKWVIQRYRLQEAAELAEKGGGPDWARLAQDMGYYDQAHLIKDFKAVIGKSPEEYVRGT